CKKIAATEFNAPHAEAAGGHEPWTRSTVGGRHPLSSIVDRLPKLPQLGQITRDVGAGGGKTDDALSRRQRRARDREGIERGPQTLDGPGIVTHGSVDDA